MQRDGDALLPQLRCEVSFCQAWSGGQEPGVRRGGEVSPRKRNPRPSSWPPGSPRASESRASPSEGVVVVLVVAIDLDVVGIILEIHISGGFSSLFQMAAAIARGDSELKPLLICISKMAAAPSLTERHLAAKLREQSVSVTLHNAGDVYEH